MADMVSEIVLDGGGPWGFRLQGGKDFGIPLNVSRVTPGSKAALKQMVVGDIICEINGVNTESLSHMEAQNHIKNAGSTLNMKIRKGKGISVGDQNAMSLGSAGSPKVLTETNVIHSASVDHTFNPKPKPFNFGTNSPTVTQGVSPQKSSPAPSAQAPKFDPGAYARKKKEELEQRKKAESTVAEDSDILKMINATSISKSPSPTSHSQTEDLPPPPPELIEEEEEPARPTFGSGGPGVQSRTFKMLQDSIGSDQAHQSVFSRPQEERNKAVPVPTKFTPSVPQQTTVNPIPKAPMPSGQNFKVSAPRAPSYHSSGQSAYKSPGPTAPSGVPATFKPSNTPQPFNAPQTTTSKVSSQKPISDDPSRTPVCQHCNQEIRGPFVSAIGKTWHPEHFACNSCKSSLQNQGFVEEQNKLFCEHCYNNFFAPKCAACGNSIIGNCVNAVGKTYHPEHFLCEKCGKNFNNEGFLIEMGKPYCEKCHDDLFGVKCAGCNRSITGGQRYVEALSRNWHTDCFVCGACKTRLDGASFYVVNGKPFCGLHKSGM